MPDADLINDLRRELAKAHAALEECQTLLARKAEANAALHCASDRVMHSPLHAKVTAALYSAQAALDRTAPPPGGPDA